MVITPSSDAQAVAQGELPFASWTREFFLWGQSATQRTLISGRCCTTEEGAPSLRALPQSWHFSLALGKSFLRSVRLAAVCCRQGRGRVPRWAVEEEGNGGVSTHPPSRVHFLPLHASLCTPGG